MSFFNELKRRNVFRVAIGYIVSSWLLLQVADLVLENIGAPGWVIQTIMLVIALGFPVVVFFSWAYEVTPEGIKRESEIDRSQSITHVTGRKLDYSILAVLILALGYFIWESRFSGRGVDSAETQPMEAVAGNELPVTAGSSLENETDERQSIAVLPFDNRSNREEDQFFTDGIHDDLLTTIANIGSMKVISRTSVMEYKNTTKKIGVIAAELGVANILEGGIQRSGNQVRINVQLIDAKTDEHLWAEIFDRELTANNLFAIQSEISRAIADALESTLSPEEIKRIDARPTENLAAYNAYLNGRQLMATRNSEQLALAVEEFNRAVALDPGFALAWVGVAQSNARLGEYSSASRELGAERERVAIDRALAIDDGLGEAYATLGSWLDGNNQLEEAEVAYQTAIRLSPNYPPAWHWYSGLLSSQISRLDEAVAAAEKAIELDPRSAIIQNWLGSVYRRKGLFSLAEVQYKKLIELHPGFAQGFLELSGLYRDALGDYVNAYRHAQKALELDPGNPWNLQNLVIILIALGELDKAEIIRERLSELAPDSMELGVADLVISLFRKNPAAAQENIRWLQPKAAHNLYATSYLAVFRSFYNTDDARNIYLSAVPAWLDPDQWQELMGLYRPHIACFVSWTLMETGDEELGRGLLQQATIFLEETLPAYVEHAELNNPEFCYLAAGDSEKAMRAIEIQLSHNHLHFWDVIHQHPLYNQIRHEPRYMAALAERERRIAVQREEIVFLETPTGR